jgi:hypothetical protein
MNSKTGGGTMSEPIPDPYRMALGNLHIESALDVATGEGSFIQILQNSLVSCREIIGIDQSSERLESARRNFDGSAVSGRQLRPGFHFQFPASPGQPGCRSGRNGAGAENQRGVTSHN